MLGKIEGKEEKKSMTSSKMDRLGYSDDECTIGRHKRPGKVVLDKT